MDASISPTISHPTDDKRKQSPPAFLDLADSVRVLVLISPHFPISTVIKQAGRLGSNMTEVTAVRGIIAGVQLEH